MRHARTRVLVTGFGPFPNVAQNATQRLVPAIAAAAAQAFPSLEVMSAILRTQWQFAPDEAERLIGELKPKVIVHFGVSGRARGFEIETVAVNKTLQHADACGAMPALGCLETDGPVALSTRWPAALIVARLRAHGLPARISRHAGHYICNAVLYRSLMITRDALRPTTAGFVHIPDTTGGIVSRSRSARYVQLSEKKAILGGLEILAACLRLPPVSHSQGLQRAQQWLSGTNIPHMRALPVGEG